MSSTASETTDFTHSVCKNYSEIPNSKVECGT